MAANLQSMHQYWKNFDLQELQRELDTTATDLAARQDDSDNARKKLVEHSRQFKKNTPEDLRKVVAPLLKCFQQEVDNLSKRSKNAEAAFVSVYKKLVDVPDPVGVLEQGLNYQKRAQRAQDLEIENKQLRETLDEYNHEFAEVKNQEVTIKQLKDKLKEHENKMEVSAQSKAKEKEKELQRQFAEKERQLQEKQLSVAKKLGEAEHKVATLQSALDSVQSELFDMKTKYDEATSAKSDEMEMVLADVERANERAAAAERQAERLNQHLASATQNLHQAEEMQKAPDMEQAIDILKRSSLEVELAAKEKEISQLVRDLQRLQNQVKKLTDSSTTQVAKLEEELSGKTRAFQMLEEKLKEQEDYDEIKRELGILKSIEFANSGEAQDGQSSEPAKPKGLETLLLEKNKTLQSETTHLKVSTTELSGTPGPRTPGSSMCNTEAFASILGQEIVASYHLRNQFHLGLENGHSGISPTSLPNGFSPGALATPLNSPPQMQYRNGNGTPVTPAQQGQDNVHLQRIHNLAKTESSNSQALDTAEVAQHIREILSTNNIGQRLFAKHVLGLSQGTVSELLSKPKHWDKLTEKGRESYRKMHAWASEDNNIMALKAIAPKKGSQPMMSSYRQEDSATDERIVQILSDAQAAMSTKQTQEKTQVTNAMVASIYQQELAKLSQKPGSAKSGDNILNNGTDVGLDGGLGRVPDTGNLSQEIVSRIYQEELQKLAQSAEQSGNMAECSMYRQELSRLAEKAQNKQRKAKLSSASEKENRADKSHEQKKSDKQNGQVLSTAFKIKQEPCDHDSTSSSSGRDSLPPPSCIVNGTVAPPPPQDMPQDLSMHSKPNAEALRHAGSAFCLVRPRSSPQGGVPAFDAQFPTMLPSDGLSPLQRMQCIANSLTAKNHSTSHVHRPLRAVLPPVTQEQFDQYSTIDTDKLVQKVKDTLSQYSISQRLFGESVLGLSQGSVSDLLARPKPWHMLTQKGREPFIRMLLFLEDDEHIPRLVASQYRISPEKLLRTDIYPENRPIPPLAGSPDAKPINSSNASASTCPHTPTTAPPPTLSTDTTLPATYSSLFEIVAMTQELDTLALTNRLKEVLQYHNLGQKLFGEVILGLSQGSVSELLSKPKPWQTLSVKGREPYVKMQMWLNHPLSTDRLKTVQNQLKARYAQLQDQYNEAFSTIQEQKQLIQQLEEDLRSVNALSYMFRGIAEGEPGPMLPSTEIVAEAVKDVQQSAVMSPIDPVKSATDSLLPIVQSQRERYRVRAQELEAQNLAQQQQVQLVQNQMDNLRSDNLKLYEKIKFLQSYPSKGSAPSDDVEGRYSSVYETKLDPFTAFNKQERRRRYDGLKPYDKVTLGIGRFVMGNKTARTVVFFYAILLHILVFLVLYKMAYTTSCHRDVAAECHHKFADHMAKVHGEMHWNE